VIEEKRKSFPYDAAALAVLLAGAVIRVVFLVQLHGSDLWELLSLDARFYAELATRIASGGGLGGVVTYNPLYPLFLAPIFRLTGHTLITVRLAQSALGIVTLWLVYKAGRLLAAEERGLGGLTGLAAMVMALLYGQFVLFEGSILATSLVTFISTTSVTIALRLEGMLKREGECAGPDPRMALWIPASGLGALLGAGALGRPNFFLLLAAIVPVWIVVGYHRWRCAAACAVGSLIVLAPILIYNSARSGQFVPVSAHGGINLYIGNRPDADGTFATPQGIRAYMEGIVEDSRAVAAQRTGRDLTHAEASRYWTGETIAAIKADPARWLALLGRKLMLFWNGSEISDVVDIGFVRTSCPVLGLLFVPFSLISAFALVGLLLVWRHAARPQVVLLFVVAGVASILPFFVNTRYRMPVLPVIILAAAYFMAWIVRSTAGRRWKGSAVYVAAAALLLALTSRAMVDVNPSAGYTFLGNFHMERRQEEKAEKAFREAYRLEPDRVETAINYARILQLRGNKEQAKVLYTDAYRRWPDFPMLAVEYASLLDAMGERGEAKEALLYAVSLGRSRDSVLACKLLSRIALSEGNGGEAVYWIRKALEILPGDKDLLEILQWIERGQ
jgi:tetratricopeptide (TPR) repeat protein